MITFENRILRSLPQESIRRLDLQQVQMERRHAIEVAGEEIRFLYFPESGIASMVSSFRDGSAVEVGMFGFESMIGAAALMGTRRSLNNIFMQLPGWAYVSLCEAAEAEFRRGEHFHDLALRYVQAQLVQTAQTAGCNARHRLEERLARWLLLCHDRVKGDEMNITQEFLAQMLGVERPAVSVEAGRLQEGGLIEYRRGRVWVLDRNRLEEVACECYGVVRRYLNSDAVDDEGMG